MRKWASLRDWRNWDDDSKSRAFGRRLSVLSDWRRSLLSIERSVIVSMRNAGTLSEEVLQEMQRDLDLEEALLERRSQAVDGHLEELKIPWQTDVSDAESGNSAMESPAPDGVDVNLGLDHDAAVDDADVSALLMDERRADGLSIGRRAAGSDGDAGPGGSGL